MKRTLFFALAASSLLLSGGELVTFDEFEGTKTEFKDGVFALQTGNESSFTLKSQRRIEVKPSIKYLVSAEIRLDKGKVGSSTVMLGFIPLAGKDYIYPQFVQSANGTNLGTLAAGAAKGATEIVVSESNWAQMWNPQRYYNVFAAFGAKADSSDLPNRNIIQVTALAEKDGKTVATLGKPLAKEYPAGTMVRLTRNDGYMYPVRVRVTAVGEWIKLSGTVEGFVKDGSAATNAWRPGTTDAQLLLLGVNAKESDWSIRNVTVEEIQE